MANETKPTQPSFGGPKPAALKRERGVAPRHATRGRRNEPRTVTRHVVTAADDDPPKAIRTDRLAAPRGHPSGQQLAGAVALVGVAVAGSVEPAHRRVRRRDLLPEPAGEDVEVVQIHPRVEGEV